MRLGRTYLDAERARLGWVSNDAGTVSAWQVEVRRGDIVRTVETLGPRRATVIVPRPERNRVFYRIIGIDDAGAVVARSNEVRVTSGDSG